MERAAAGGPAGHHRHGLGSTARTEWMAAPTRIGRAGRGRRRAPAQASAAPIGEAALGGVELGTDPALEVTGVEQGDPDARPRRRPSIEGPAHGVGVVVGHAAGAMVEVVELAHDADAGQGHLGEGGPGQPVVGVGVEGGGHGVHLLPPCPEGALAGLGPAPQRPVEGVAVGVGQSRQGQPGQAGRHPAVGPRPPDRLDALIADADEDVRLGLLAAQPGQLAVVALHRSGADAGDELGDAGHERGPVVPLELLPGGERGRVGHPVEEQPAVEVVALVLERAGGQAPLDLVVRVAVPVEPARPGR